MTKQTLYYNGKWQNAQSDDYAEVINPTTEEVIDKVVNANEEDVNRAVSAAKAAFDDWNTTAPSKRAEYVQKILDGIKEREEELIETMIEELGTSRQFAKNTQVGLAEKEMGATLEDCLLYTSPSPRD